MKDNSYTKTLKASAFTGGAQVVTLLAGFIRMKVAALLLGPSGVGLLGLFNQANGVISSVASLGLGKSAVREIAAAEGVKDSLKLSRVVRTLRFLVWSTGGVAAILCAVFSSVLSIWTFGDTSQSFGFILLGISIFLTQLSSGQGALLRGLGRIKELALQTVSASLLSTFVGILCYWLWRDQGIAPSLLASAGILLGFSWWHARKIHIDTPAMSLAEVMDEGRGMLKMGLGFVWSTFVAAGVAYGIGVLIRSELGVDANGLYQAAWSISGMFVGFVLNAMGQDFYPRLTASIHKPQEASQLLNVQTETGILLALPGIVGTISLCTWIMPLLFSEEFRPACDSVIWFAMGCFGRVISWPLGFAMIARGDALRYSMNETLISLVNFGLSWIGLIILGLPGVAVGFFLTYVIYSIRMRVIIGHMIGFYYTIDALRLIVISIICLLCATICGPWLGLVLTPLCAIFCLRGIVFRVGYENSLVKKILKIPLFPLLLRKTTSSMLKI